MGDKVRAGMSPDDFRHIALSMPRAEEVFRRGRSEFRVRRTMFAALAGPADSLAVIKLTPEQQAIVVSEQPLVFAAEPGGWGRLGSTVIRLTVASVCARRRHVPRSRWSRPAVIFRPGRH
jgi:hypothetical protein